MSEIHCERRRQGMKESINGSDELCKLAPDGRIVL